MSSITLKGIDNKLYRTFRALAILKGITVQEALEEAIRVWIKLNSHLFIEENVDMIIEYIRKHPAEPFVYTPKERPIKRWSAWARKKLGMTQ